jgi:DNA repair exonuclease SbcCD ATPase subunit
MEILRLQAKNFFSIGEVDLDVSKRGLTLVTGDNTDAGGSNGSGKSTLAVKILTWGIFGRTPYDEKGDDAIPSGRGKTRPSVRVTFRRGKHWYIVDRGRNPSSLSIFRWDRGRVGSSPIESELHNLSRRDASSSQSLIEHLVGRDFKSFIQTDFFGQGRNKSFLDCSPKEQVEILEEILPIDQVTEWSEEAKKWRDIRADDIEKLNLKLAELKGKLETISNVHKTNERNQKHWNESRANGIEEAHRQLKNISAVNNRVRNRIEDYQKKDPGEPDFVRMSEIEDNKKELYKTRQDIHASSALWGKKYTELHGKLKSLQVTHCPTCEQPLKGKASEEVVLERHKLVERVELADQSVTDCHASTVRVNRMLEDLEKERADLCDQHQNHTKIKTEIANLRAELDDITEAGIKERLDILNKQKNPHDKNVEHSRKLVKKSELAVAGVREQMARVAVETGCLDFWHTLFSKDFKNYLFRKACPYLEAQTNKHLRGLGNSQLQVYYSTAKLLKSGDSRVQFNVKVRSTAEVKSYKSFSSGEKQIVNFAVGLALADLAGTQVKGSSNVLLLDEPFENLDSRNCENLVNYLTDELAKTKATILLVSNEENLQSLIPERINVVKRQGLTSIAS